MFIRLLCRKVVEKATPLMIEGEGELMRQRRFFTANLNLRLSPFLLVL